MFLFAFFLSSFLFFIKKSDLCRYQSSTLCPVDAGEWNAWFTDETRRRTTAKIGKIIICYTLPSFWTVFVSFCGFHLDGLTCNVTSFFLPPPSPFLRATDLKHLKKMHFGKKQKLIFVLHVFAAPPLPSYVLCHRATLSYQSVHCF